MRYFAAQRMRASYAAPKFPSVQHVSMSAPYSLVGAFSEGKKCFAVHDNASSFDI